MSQLTPQNIEDFIARFQTHPEYKNDARVKALVDEKADRLRILAEGDLDVLETLGKISEIIQEIVARINEVAMEEKVVELLKKLGISYFEMVDTLESYGYTDEIPDGQTVQQAVLKLGPAMLGKISHFNKPTLLLMPVGDLSQKKTIIDSHKKYDSEDGSQGDVALKSVPLPTPLYGPAPGKFKVSIVDGMTIMSQTSEQIVGVNPGDIHKTLTAKFEGDGMKMITSHEYAMLIQVSLRSYERVKVLNDPAKDPEDELIDRDNVTLFHCENAEDLGTVPSGFWDESSARFVIHDEVFLNFDGINFVSRPSVEVMEFEPQPKNPPADSTKLKITIDQLQLYSTLSQSYDLMVDTLGFFNFDNHFAAQKKPLIMEAIMKLPSDELLKIAQFGKPAILITPPGSFDSKVQKINQHKIVPGQKDTLCDHPADLVWDDPSTSWQVSIVDGVDAMPKPKFITGDLKNGQNMKKYMEEFAKENLEMMSCHEGAMLMMKSLFSGQPIDDSLKSTTLTVYRPVDHSIGFQENFEIPSGSWNSNKQCVRFSVIPSDGQVFALRARPSLHVMDFESKPEAESELSPEELMEALEKSYDDGLATLTAFGFDAKKAAQAKGWFIDEINQLEGNEYLNIAEMHKPTVVITPPGSFEDKVMAINAHKKMPNQFDCSFSHSVIHHKWGPAQNKWIVSIVDGVDAMPQPDFINDKMNVGQKMEQYEKAFAQENLDVMSCHEGAMLIMQSLNHGKPIDDWNRTNTSTFYNRSNLTKNDVPWGHWRSGASFYLEGAEKKNEYLRCRPSAKIIEF